MSVWFAEQVIAKLRERGVVVTDTWTNWRNNGNGQTSNYQGAIMHHTATNYGDAFPALVNGRPDLSGPLCNSAGCADGSITIVSAHPANHAGAAGGSWARPFPDTNDFNRMVWGHEIVYPGNSPMTDAQWHSMVVLGQVICEILGKGPEWIRGHYETSTTGKWDPGYAPGKWINMNDVRAQIGGPRLGGEPDDMFSDDDRWLLDDVFELVSGTRRIEDVHNLGYFPGVESLVTGGKITPLDLTRWNHRHAIDLWENNAKQKGLVDKLAAQVAKRHDIDADALIAGIESAVADGVAEADVEVTVEVPE